MQSCMHLYSAVVKRSPSAVLGYQLAGSHGALHNPEGWLPCPVAPNELWYKAVDTSWPKGFWYWEEIPGFPYTGTLKIDTWSFLVFPAHGDSRIGESLLDSRMGHAEKVKKNVCSARLHMRFSGILILVDLGPAPGQSLQPALVKYNN